MPTPPIIRSVDASLRGAETALLESKRFLRSTLDALSARIAILDQHGTIIAVNSAWTRFADENDLNEISHGVGVNYLKICDSASQDSSAGAAEAASGIRAVMAGQSTEFQLEYPCHSPREMRWFVLRATRFAEEGSLRVVVAHEAIAARKESESELRKLSRAVEQSPVSVMITDLQGGIEYVNPKFCTVTGYSFEEVRGKNASMLESGEMPPEVYRNMWDCLAADQEWRGEFHNRKKNGQLYWESASISGICDDTGKVTHFVAVKEDITERKQVIQKLAEHEEREARAQRALAHERELSMVKNRFVSIVSHEFRTPLAVINTAAHLLGRYSDRMSDVERTGQVEEIQNAVGRMAEMMEDLLVHGNLQSGKMKCATLRVDVDAFCRRLILEVSSNPFAGCTVEFVVGPNVQDAFLDERILRCILSNLLCNAFKYSNLGKSVTLEVQRVGGNQLIDADTKTSAGDHLQFKVSDTGIGIPTADLSKIFLPFYRASNIGNRPGTGMGLSIVKQAVELHRGAIKVESEEGKGTTFLIWVPLTLPDPAAPVLHFRRKGDRLGAKRTNP